MPLYEYHCPACGHHFETLVRGGSNTQPKTCPQCGAAALEKAVSRIAPAGKIEAIRLANRRAAAAQGHFSHYSAAEQARLLKGKKL
ncbi:MAG: zinc ribbon domain-containing protein [Burkholderiaceae bacterium]|jgi:putative FmdB family regulatory protein|nr:zinc ribbon domain-containing protein [Burkholderiaceae bacterium]